MENWKFIEGYDDCYEISDKGNIRSHYGWNGREYFKRKEPLMMKQTQKPEGYLYVRISNKNNGAIIKHAYVHRLVAEAFCDKSGYEHYDGKLQVNHLDFDKSNNCAENLEWCTQKENQKHFFASNKFEYDLKKLNKIKSQNKRDRLDYHSPHVVYLYKETDLSIKEMAKILPIGRDKISEILKIEGLI